jgi:hypothetical protein
VAGDATVNADPETWRPVVGHPGYEVSSHGRVRRPSPHADRARARGFWLFLRPELTAGGYLRVRFYGEGKETWRRLHLIVLEAFVGPIPSSAHHGAHAPDRDKTNCRADNLAWKLPFENEADKRAHGTHANGGGRKVWTPAETLAAIHSQRAAGVSFTKIARALNLHRSTVSRIARGLRRRA